MKCPHCGHKAVIRSSEYLSPMTKKNYHRCTYIHCLHHFNTLLTITETVKPSLTPNPKVKIPISIYGIKNYVNIKKD